MKKISVKLKENSYGIIISNDNRDFVSELKKLKGISSFFIVSDSNIAKIHLNDFKNLLLKSRFNVKSVIIKAGETGKSLQSLSFLYDMALKADIDRQSCVLALGGGVVGDCAGFFASTYMRGIKYIQIPTTLLAMCDSSIGGKTAVNTKGGKNIAGSFYQPAFVFINTDFLKTLCQKQINNGLAEIIKYAFSFEYSFIKYLAKALDGGIINKESFEYMIYKSCIYKSQIVEKDVKETKNLRAILNLGHTLAHAIETATKYNKFLHGEAVSIGLLFAAKLSVLYKLCSQEVYDKLKDLLKSAGLIFDADGLNALRLVNLMKKDKKSVHSKIKFVLLKGFGKAQAGYYVEDEIIYNQLKRFLNQYKGEK